jgi:hypothetical protein
VGKTAFNEDDDYTEIIENMFATWKAIRTKHAVLTNFSEVQKPTIKDTPYFLEDKYGKAEHLVIQAQDNQCKCAEEIKKIRTNFKKDSTARKTRSYLEQRLSQKYSANNIYLQRFFDKSDEYYETDMEKQVAEMVDATVNEIKNQLTQTTECFYEEQEQTSETSSKNTSRSNEFFFHHNVSLSC